MVAAGGAVDVRRATELAHPQHDGIVEQAALVELLHERAHGFIDDAQLPLEAREYVAVHVPAAEIDLDERHAFFDQAAGHQAARHQSHCGRRRRSTSGFRC